MNETLYRFLENHPEAPLAQQLFSDEQLEEFALSKGQKKAFKIGGISAGSVAGLGGAVAGASALVARAGLKHIREHAGSGSGGAWSHRHGGTGGTGFVGGTMDRIAQNSPMGATAPEMAKWYNPARQWGRDVGAAAKKVGTGIKENATEVVNKYVAPNGGTIAAVAGGAAAAAGGAVLARNLYLKKRMKQTGTTTKAAFKQVANARKAEKKALKRVAGMNRTKLRSALTSKFGY